MSYHLTNPFQENRSTFMAAAGTSGRSQVLFSGLPLDVSEKDLRDLLLASPMKLAASTTSVDFVYTSAGGFTGVAIVSVGHADDAEQLRRDYSGREIDGKYRIAVQHILAPTQPIPPTQTVTPFAPAPILPPSAPAASTSQYQQPRQQHPKQVQQQKVPAAPRAQAIGGGAVKPPGLKLLARLSKPGGAGGGAPFTTKERQLGLLAQQKANIKGKPPGASLLGRIARPTNNAASHPAAKTQPKPVRLSSGTDKVERAKGKANMNGSKMDVDQEVRVGVKGKDRSRGKTEQELNEEMRLWERERRFA